jgi:hypothetical protein
MIREDYVVLKGVAFKVPHPEGDMNIAKVS